ncbi:hypothetical protein FRC04_009472 [Tulasnella sp. 424]|nr:hypothetical protein FRC04_009472 [Tulasnella sp. 424]KAG8963311.1 hypothetical protein FRC05_004785 [Tulasnella sp. 425]
MASDRLRNSVHELIRDHLADFLNESKQSGKTFVREADMEISRFDEERACLQNIQKAITAETWARVARVSTQRNSLLPIQRLPPEILTYIVEESLGYLDAHPERRTTRRLRELASVCRQWNYALDQNPSLWSRIDHTRDASFAAHKSGNAPLSINFVNEGYLTIDELKRGLAPLRPHSQRWRSLQLCMESSVPLQFDMGLESVSTSNLEDLGFLVHSTGRTRMVPNLDRHPLRRLVLSSISTSWDTVACMTGLRSLTISDLADGLGCPSADQIAGILSGLSQLEELTLSNLEAHLPDVSGPPPAPPTFYLPALRSLALGDVCNTREAAMWLFECITAPNLIGLSLTGNRMSPIAGDVIVDALKRHRTDSLLLVVMASLALHQKVCARITHGGCHITCGHEVRRGAHWGVEIYLPQGTYAEAWQGLIDVASGFMGDLPLDVEIDKHSGQWPPSPDPDPACLNQVSSLSVLRLGYDVKADAFLRYLFTEIPGNQAKYPCPNLTEVYVRRSFTGTETRRQAMNLLMDKRPDLALYEEDRRFSGDST